MMDEKFRFKFKSFHKIGSGFLNLYYSPNSETFDLEYESGYNATLDPELSQTILKCCCNYADMQRTHIISENEQVTIEKIELVTKPKINDWFNKFSDMSKQELIDFISKKNDSNSAVNASMLAEATRALFINCSYTASLENAKLKNGDACYFYSKTISDAYKNNYEL